LELVNMAPFPWLTLILFLPLFGGFGALAAGRRPRLCRWLSLSFALADLALVVLLFFLDLNVQRGPTGAWLLAEDHPWIPSLGIRYSLGLDGVSLMLILLTALLTVLCILVSWRAIDDRVGSFHFFLLFIETGILGVFLASDLFLFYLFWEVQLLPMFFLVGVWGHQHRIRATIKFILFTVAGSLLMLVALIGLYLLHGAGTGDYTFSLQRLMHTPLTRTAEIWLFAAFLLAFVIKIPVIPLHNWLPDTHTEAPTAGSVILAGLLLKTGAYAVFRIGFPLFPVAARLAAPVFLGLGVAGLFYAAWIALAQNDIKRLVAYSSIAHMGLVVMGLAVWSVVTLNGALLQMINHGITTSALFIMVGMLDERTHSREFAAMGGIWKKMPAFGAFFLFFAMSSLGLPGLNNFVGEILILIGTFQTWPVIAILGFAGLVLGLVYVLRMVQDILFGEPRKEVEMWDLTPRETVVLGILALGVLFIGLHPSPVLKWFDEPVRLLLQQTTQHALLRM
jgi:NADH-quinone oxidoreductase subunit M